MKCGVTIEFNTRQVREYNVYTSWVVCSLSLRTNIPVSLILPIFIFHSSCSERRTREGNAGEEIREKGKEREKENVDDFELGMTEQNWMDSGLPFHPRLVTQQRLFGAFFSLFKTRIWGLRERRRPQDDFRSLKSLKITVDHRENKRRKKSSTTPGVHDQPREK